LYSSVAAGVTDRRLILPASCIQTGSSDRQSAKSVVSSNVTVRWQIFNAYFVAGVSVDKQIFNAIVLTDVIADRHVFNSNVLVDISGGGLIFSSIVVTEGVPITTAVVTDDTADRLIFNANFADGASAVMQIFQYIAYA
jgi:hypothetical protein